MSEFIVGRKYRRAKTARVHKELAAEMLACAELHSVSKAEQKYGVSGRTISRYKAEVRAGKHPEIAALLEEEKRRAIQRAGDRIVDTLDEVLGEIRDRIKKFSPAELIQAADKLGQLRITRDALGGAGTGSAGGSGTTSAPGARAAMRPGQGSGFARKVIPIRAQQAAAAGAQPSTEAPSADSSPASDPEPQG